MMRRHELDPLSLVVGFLFTAFGLLFLVGQPEAAVRLRWLWPLLLLGLGLAILAGARPRRPAGPADGQLDEASGAGPGAEDAEPEPAEPEPAEPEPAGTDRAGPPARPPAGES
jgi:hypothetical protein